METEWPDLWSIPGSRLKSGEAAHLYIHISPIRHIGKYDIAVQIWREGTSVDFGIGLSRLLRILGGYGLRIESMIVPVWLISVHDTLHLLVRIVLILSYVPSRRCVPELSYSSFLFVRKKGII